MSTKNQNDTNTTTDTPTPKKRGRVAGPKKEYRAVLVNLDPQVAESFIRLAKTQKFFGVKSPTALARQLIERFVTNNQKKLEQLDCAESLVVSELAATSDGAKLSS